jgi:hypothetical protein
MIFSNCSSLIPSADPKYGFTAAFDTRMSIVPNVAFANSVSALRSSLRVMLHAVATAAFRSSASLMEAATPSQASIFRLETMTFAPCWARRRAIASPMPREAPVMTADLPVKSKRVFDALIHISRFTTGASIRPHDASCN